MPHAAPSPPLAPPHDALTRSTTMRHPAFALALAAVIGLTLLAHPGTARADNNSILTLGLGAGVGWRHAAGPGENAEMKFVNQVSARLKMLWILGADFSVDLTRDTALTEAKDGDLRYAAKMRLTALFYPVVTRHVQVYLGAGVGAADKSEMFSFTSPGNSYHAGGGVEFHLDSHFTIDLSFYMLIPGYHSVRTHAEHLALSIAEDHAVAVANGSAPPPNSIHDLPLPELKVGDYVSPANYEVMLRIFVFL